MLRLCIVIAASAAAAAALSAAWEGPASAAVTWSSAGVLQFTDTGTGTTITCSSSSATMVPANSGTGPVGQITSISFTGCEGPLSTAITMTAKGLDWPIRASPLARTVGETSGGHGVSVAVSAPGCTATVDGTGAGTHTGTVGFTVIRESGKTGVMLVGGNLHIYNPVGCGGLVANGDAVTFTASYLFA